MKNKRLPFLLMLLLCLCLLMLVLSKKNNSDTHVDFNSDETPKELSDEQAEDLENTDSNHSPFEGEIVLNPMVELDFKSQREILQLRKEAMQKYPELINGEYEPHKGVFGQIMDQKPWWGIDGHYYFGPGQESINGPSEESRFVVNPYLLVGVIEPNAYVMTSAISQPEAFPPLPTEIFWSSRDATVTVHYDVGRYFQKTREFGYPNAQERSLSLVAYNARDFGFNFLYVDPEKSQNIVSMNSTMDAVLIRQFIHCGGSCGYPGGCNNMSPKQAELAIRVPDLPAKTHIKLWKKKPASVEDEPDMLVLIEMT